MALESNCDLVKKTILIVSGLVDRSGAMFPSTLLNLT